MSISTSSKGDTTKLYERREPKSLCPGLTGRRDRRVVAPAAVAAAVEAAVVEAVVAPVPDPAVAVEVEVDVASAPVVGPVAPAVARAVAPAATVAPVEVRRLVNSRIAPHARWAQ